MVMENQDMVMEKSWKNFLSSMWEPWNEAPRGPLWAAGHQTDKKGRSPDPAVALVPVT